MPWLVGVGVLVAIVLGVRRSRRVDEERQRATLRSASPSTLAAKVRDALRGTDWARLPSGAALSGETTWSDTTLLAALRDLLRELDADDRARSRSGRDSAFFEFHDRGLNGIMDALEARSRAS